MTAVPQPAVRIALFTARFAPVLPAEGFRDIPCQSGSGDDFALRRRGSSQSPGVAVNATDYRFLLLGFCPRFLSGRLELELVGRYRRGLLRRIIAGWGPAKVNPNCGSPPGTLGHCINDSPVQGHRRVVHDVGDLRPPDPVPPSRSKRR